jgi:hypothetical protein
VIYLFIGRRELGKTTLAYKMLRNRAIRKRAVIDARRMINQSGFRVETVTTAGEANEALFAMMDGESDEVIYQPFEDDIKRVSFPVWTRALKQIVIEFPQTDVAMLVDEASFYDLEIPSFQWLVKCAKRDHSHILITAHQPKDIPTSVRSIADHWFIFRTTQETDLDKIREKSPEAANAARTLEDRSYVHWNDANARMTINHWPSNWYIALESNDVRNNPTGRQSESTESA